MVAAQYFEAALLQDKKKAFDYHFKIFESQSTLQKGGIKFLLKLAKELGFDMVKLTKDANSGKVLLRTLHLNRSLKYCYQERLSSIKQKRDTKFDSKSALLKIFVLHLSSWRQKLFMLIISPIHTSAPKFER